MIVDNNKFSTPLLSKNSYVQKNHQTFTDRLQLDSNETISYDEQYVATKRLSWKDLFPQILVSIVAFLLVIQPGINMVYSNIFLYHYEFTDESELSWLSGIFVLCTPIGTIMVGIVTDRIGRKNAILLTCVPLLISWSIASVVCSENTSLLYACRLFAGIGGGMTSIVVIYISEIAHSSYKQVLLSLNSVFFSVGVLFATTVGSLFQWQTVNVVFFVFTVVTTILLIILLPESPVWLIKFKPEQVYKARSSLKRIYPKNNQVFVEEWDNLKYAMPSSLSCTVQEVLTPSFVDPSSSVDDNNRCAGRVRRHSRRRRSWCWWWWCRWWCKSQPPAVIRPIRVLAVVFLLQQLSGCYPVMLYVLPVLRSVTSSIGSDAGEPTQMETLIALGVVRLLTSVVACALSPHVGRRPLLIASSLAMACSAALVAVTCPSTAVGAADGHGEHAPPLLPVVGVAMFVCSGSAGVLVFPWTLIGELLPVSVRAVAGTLLVSYAYVLMFVMLKIFPYFVALNGRDGSLVTVVFAAFAAASLAMAAYTHACLPETLGKQFREIEEYFANS